jgi:GLPGLI family protein
MNKLFLIIIILLASNCFSQQLEVSYKGMINDVNESIPKDFDQKYYVKAQLMLKQIGTNLSVHDIKINTIGTSSYLLSTTGGMKSDASKRGFDSVVNDFLCLEEDIFVKNNQEIYSYTDGDKFITTYDGSQLCEYEITADSKMILGYLSFKAIPIYKHSALISKKTMPKEVWFTPDLPFTGGPLLFAELPGIVLQTKSNFITITATKIKKSNKKVDVPQVDKPVYTFEQSQIYYDKLGKAIRERFKN